MGKIISLINQKGGVAKTTSVGNIAYILANKFNKKVAVIDMDQQGNLTTHFKIKKDEIKTVFDLMRSYDIEEFYDVKVSNVIVNSKNVDVFPNNSTSKNSESKLNGVGNSESLLKEIISDLNYEYDYILIDCPPNLDLMTRNALISSDKVYIPVEPSLESLEGMADLYKEIEIIKRRLNKRLEIGGVFLTKVDPRTKLFRKATEILEQYFNDKIMKTFIRNEQEVKNLMMEKRMFICEVKNTKAGLDYLELTKEIISREEN